MEGMPVDMQSSQAIGLVEGGDIQDQQSWSIEEVGTIDSSEEQQTPMEGGVTIQEMPVGGEMTMQEISTEGMPADMRSSQVNGFAEGIEIKELPLDNGGIQEEPLPVEEQLEDSGVSNIAISTWTIEEVGEIGEEEPEQNWSVEVIGTIDEKDPEQSWSIAEVGTIDSIDKEQLPMEGDEIKEMPLDTNSIQEEQLPTNEILEDSNVSNIAESTWTKEKIGEVREQEPEQNWSVEVIGTVEEKGLDQGWSIKEVGVIDSREVIKDTSLQGNDKKYDSNPVTPKTPETLTGTVKVPGKEIEEAVKVDVKDRPKSGGVEKETNYEANTSKQTQGIKSPAAQKVTCHHDILIDQFVESISRLEKEKDYLEKRYDALRNEKETEAISRGEQLTNSQDHHHCCDVAKDYSSLIEYITSSRDVSLDEYSDVRGCGHNHVCEIHGGARETLRNSNQMSADYEYYKSKCDQIKREKERLERAYEAEKRQKEEFEKEYRNENDEKIYLEERYQGMLDSINRFDETIRSLRMDNELLQSKLNDWAKSGIATHTLDISSMKLGQGDDGEEIPEYRRNIRALEKENREFRAILEVLSKKNESQDSLKNIELGLARENEFIELKREKVRLEGTIKEMKQTNKHQQERIEEIRRDSTTEVSRLKEKTRKLERSLKENERILEEKDDEIVILKKRHSEEIQAMEIRLQTQLSNTVLAKSREKDLKSKIERLEEERSRLREELKTTSTGSRDRYLGMEEEYQDTEMVRQRYEDERRSKMRLANDMKYLLSDIMDLKERNQRLQEDFNRERMEIKAMIEKQANEITQEYLTQISKLQRSLLEETKRRQEAEAAKSGLFSNQENFNLTGQREMNTTSGLGDSDFQQQLKDEIRRRETLEVENKKLLYKMNEILSGNRNGRKEDAFDNFKSKETSSSRNETKVSYRDNNEGSITQKELQSEIEDLQEKIEDLKKEAKRNKELKRRNEDLEEEVSHLTRKRDELLAAQRNLTREADLLSRTLDEVERRNRKLTDETERFTRKIQDIEDSFRQEKINLVRNYENEKARAVEEVTNMKKVCDKKLQVQTDTTRKLEEKIQQIEHQISANGGSHSIGLNGTSTSHAENPYGILGDFRSQGVYSQDEKLKQQVENLEAMLRDVNKKHADDLKNLEAQKRRMSEEFQREKESLEDYFEKENSSLQKRLRDVESSIRGGDVRSTNAPGADGNVENFKHTGWEPLSTSGHRDNGARGTMTFESSVTRRENYNGRSRDGEAENRIQEIQQRFREEKREMLNRASEEKAKLEDEVREAKEKLTNYRRLFEDEIDDLKRKHRKEQEVFDEKLSKERADFEERLRIASQNGSKAMVGMSPTQRSRYDFDDETRISRQNRIGEQANQNGFEAVAGISGTQRNQYSFKEDYRLPRHGQFSQGNLGNQNASSNMVDMSATQRKRYGIDESERMRGGEQNSPKFEGERRELQHQLQNEKRKLMETIEALTKEVNALKCEKQRLKDCYKREVEKLTRIHEVEKNNFRERVARDKDDEISRMKKDYDGRLASERKRLQEIIDEFRRKMSLTEGKFKEMEIQHKNEKTRYLEEKRNAEKTLIQSQEELKMIMEREYRKMLNDEKQKFEQTVKALSRQISFLQDQRKEIQEKLLNNELLGDSSPRTEQLSRNRVVIQMEQEFYERVDREKRPMEEKIRELQQEINKLKREKSELKGTLENEKQELEDELEKIQLEMKRKLSKAREEMEKRTDVLGKHIMANTIKNALVSTLINHSDGDSLTFLMILFVKDLSFGFLTGWIRYFPSVNTIGHSTV